MGPVKAGEWCLGGGVGVASRITVSPGRTHAELLAGHGLHRFGVGSRASRVSSRVSISAPAVASRFEPCAFVLGLGHVLEALGDDAREHPQGDEGHDGERG